MRYLTRFLIITLILALFPFNVMATAPSRQLGNSIMIEPVYEITLAEESDEWPPIAERVKELLEDYILLEAFKINLDKPCEELLVTLLRPLITEDEPIVLIIHDDIIDTQEIGFDEFGRARVDLTEYELGEYWLCFCIKGEYA